LRLFCCKTRKGGKALHHRAMMRAVQGKFGRGKFRTCTAPDAKGSRSPRFLELWISEDIESAGNAQFLPNPRPSDAVLGAMLSFVV